MCICTVYLAFFSVIRVIFSSEQDSQTIMKSDFNPLFASVTILRRESWVISAPHDYFWNVFLLHWPDSKPLKSTRISYEETLTFIIFNCVPFKTVIFLSNRFSAQAKKAQTKIRKISAVQTCTFYIGGCWINMNKPKCSICPFKLWSDKTVAPF